MAFVRSLLREFQTRNDLYAGASVSAFVPDGSGNPTATLVTLYAGPTGATTLGNPQVLDGEGKFRQPVYHKVSVVLTVSSAFATSHNTGVIRPSLSDADVAAAAASAAAAAATLAQVQAVAAQVNLPPPIRLASERLYLHAFAN